MERKTREKRKRKKKGVEEISQDEKNNNNRGKEFRYVTYIQQLNYPY